MRCDDSSPRGFLCCYACYQDFFTFTWRGASYSSTKAQNFAELGGHGLLPPFPLRRFTFLCPLTSITSHQGTHIVLTHCWWFRASGCPPCSICKGKRGEDCIAWLAQKGQAGSTNEREKGDEEWMEGRRRRQQRSFFFLFLDHNLAERSGSCRLHRRHWLSGQGL
jgi:hypothetical protein